MNLKDRLNITQKPTEQEQSSQRQVLDAIALATKAPAEVEKQKAAPVVNNSVLAIKSRCQKKAAEDEAFYRADSQETRQDLRPRLEELIRQESQVMGYPLSEIEIKQLSLELLDEIYGLGPIEPLMADPSVSDIMINGHKQVYVERKGKIELTDISFISEEHLRNKVDRMLYVTGRRVDERSPLVDARLADGSRINVIIPPLAVDGIVVSIRRFPKNSLRAKDLINFGAMVEPMFKFLELAVESGLNIIVCGGTGSGKTTMLNILSGLIPSDERIVTIEDSAELRMQQNHVVRLETRPPNAEGVGEVTQRDLLKNALRMRPDRIILGEVRGGEVLDMLQAMNTGHDGSLATLHANSPRDCISRLELMINLSGVDIPPVSIRRQIDSTIDLIIYVDRMRDGKRRVISVSEVAGVEEDNVVLQDIFNFDQQINPVTKETKNLFKATGLRPRCAAKIEDAGHHIPGSLFNFTMDVH
jgi:pilus assembly protein CpaF